MIHNLLIEEVRRRRTTYFFLTIRQQIKEFHNCFTMYKLCEYNKNSLQIIVFDVK